MSSWFDISVIAKRPVADGVVALDLATPDRGELPGWEPGAHIDLDLGPNLIRSYSLCGASRERDMWTVAVLREEAGRGGSRLVHDQLSAGETLRVRGPVNAFPLEPASAYLFIAGGIGITPILPMIEHAERANTPWWLLYGGRSRRSMAFVDVLGSHGARVSLIPEDELGRLPLDEVLAEDTYAEAVIYACGPASLLAAIRERCTRACRELHLEDFAPPALAGADHGFEIELASSGQVLRVPPEGTILSTLEQSGIDVLSSCRTGTCGTCEIPVLQGQPDHRDEVLTEDEKASNQHVIACVSRAKSARIVLDC